MTEDLRQPGEQLLWKTSGNMKQGKETWWWNEDVQESIQTKTWPREPLTRIITKRKKLHNSKEGSKEERSYCQSKGIRSPVCRHGYHRRTEESIEDSERKGKELERHLSVKRDQR